ncbi:phosphatase PAP2 family protein [Arenibaculum pallidiluteum]|uniref:phosphatase PAP2 family protein n=1 Tax=Arenibaculum pallidiluteum TaxID=2812559 RepID=UPI001A96F14B|nr:phosphatase PAP2 family protein [Arenibaculum pallidiluteum]
MPPGPPRPRPTTEPAPRPSRYPAIVRLSAFAILVLVAHLAVGSIDVVAALRMRETSEGVRAFFGALTELGDSKWYLVPTGVLGVAGLLLVRFAGLAARLRALLRWGSGAALFLFAAIAISGIAANVIKALIGRARPKLLGFDEVLAISPLTLRGDLHSFPSGHSNTAFALALALGLLAPRLRLPLLAAAALVASSRVVIGAHYVTDVVGGAALAVVTTYWLRSLCLDRGWLFAAGPDGSIRPRRPAVVLAARLARGAAWARSRLRGTRAKLRRPPADKGEVDAPGRVKPL